MKGRINDEWIKEKFVPFVPTKRLSLCITDEDIDETLIDLLEDLEIEEKKREYYLRLSRKDKIILLKKQEKLERTIPSPEWIVNLISIKCNKMCLNYIESSFKNARKSWGERFIDSGGHILLFRELASRSSYCSFFSNSFPYNTPRIIEIIKIIEIVIDSFNDKKTLIPKYCVEIVVQSFDRFKYELFSESISLLYKIASLENGPEYIISAFRKLPDVNGQISPFKIFGDIIEANPYRASRNLFFKLIYKLFKSLKNYPEKISLIFDYLNSGLINVLKNLSIKEKKKFGSKLGSFIQQVDAYLLDINSIFDGKAFKCTCEQSIVNVLEESSFIGPVLINILSIFKNQKDVFEKLMIFLYHFLTCFRKNIIIDKKDFAEASMISFKSTINENENEPNISPNISDNEYYCYLFNKYKYIKDSDLKNVNYHFNDENNKNDDKLNLIAELQKKLDESSKEIERLKQELEEERKKEPIVIEKEVTDNNDKVLQKKLDEALTEIDKLRADQLRILDLSRFIPTEINPVRPISYINVLPSDSINICDVKNKFEEIRKYVREDQNVDNLFDDVNNKLDLIDDERNQIENNTKKLIGNIQKDLDEMNNELNQINSLKSKIINGIENGFDNNNEEEDIDEIPTQDNNPTNSHIFLIPYEKLNERCSKSKRWKEVLKSLISVNEEEITNYFTNEINDGKLLSERTIKKYQKLIKNLSSTPEIIVQHIDQELFKISENNLRYLLRISISKQERFNLLSFNGDTDNLNEAEKFGVLLYRIQNWRNKVKVMIELHNFDDDMSVIINNIQKYSTALSQIKKSTLLPKALGSIISIANYMNGGSDFGGASSFSLLDLKEFKFFKSNTKGISFMNYIAAVLERNQISAQNIQNDLKALQTVSKINLNSIGEKLTNAQISLARRKRTPFVTGASSRIHHTFGLYNEVVDQYNKIANGYGINAILLREKNLIPILLEFSSDLIKAVKENKAMSFLC